jgi:hypothetical protein
VRRKSQSFRPPGPHSSKYFKNSMNLFCPPGDQPGRGGWIVTRHDWEETAMLSRIMVLAATVSFIALTAPHTASFAQTPAGSGYESIEDLKRRYRKEDCDRAFRDGQKYLEFARIGAEKAAKLRELERIARADTKSDGEYANVLDGVAKAKEKQAKDDLDRAKAEFAKASCTDAVINALIYFAIDQAELLIYPSARPEAEDEVEPAPQKEKKSQEKKKQTKTEKPKKPANIKKADNKTNKVAGRMARDVAIAVTTGLLLDQIAGKHGKRRKICNHNCGGEMNEMGDKPLKGMRKLKRLKKIGLELF